MQLKAAHTTRAPNITHKYNVVVIVLISLVLKRIHKYDEIWQKDIHLAKGYTYMSKYGKSVAKCRPLFAPLLLPRITERPEHMLPWINVFTS